MRPKGLPLLGAVAAGQPMLAEENIEDYVAVPPAAGGGDGEYLLRVRGESMQKVGIMEGDLVVVRPQETAQDGDIVVAMVGEDATVKRYFRESDHVRLQPENDEMEPIRSREVRILGRVVGLMRSLYERPSCCIIRPESGVQRWRGDALLAASQAAAEVRLRGKSGHHRAGWSLTTTRGNPRESATETNRPSARPHVSRVPARVKWCGKSAPAPR